MAPGAGAPEDLDRLLEDALVLRDQRSVSRLFVPGAVLIAGGEHRGRSEIEHAAPRLWEMPYIAETRGVHQARDVALVLGRDSIAVARRGGSGWRYAVALVGPPVV